MRTFHPYAIILGLGLGVVIFFTLRHPLFALFGGIASMVGIDYALKNKKIDDGDQ